MKIHVFTHICIHRTVFMFVRVSICIYVYVHTSAYTYLCKHGPMTKQVLILGIYTCTYIYLNVNI